MAGMTNKMNMAITQRIKAILHGDRAPKSPAMTATPAPMTNPLDAYPSTPPMVAGCAVPNQSVSATLTSSKTITQPKNGLHGVSGLTFVASLAGVIGVAAGGFCNGGGKGGWFAGKRVPHCAQKVAESATNAPQ